MESGDPGICSRRGEEKPAGALRAIVEGTPPTVQCQPDPPALPPALPPTRRHTHPTFGIERRREAAELADSRRGAVRSERRGGGGEGQDEGESGGG